VDRYETDTVVLGLGAMGCASLYQLALRGIPAIGVEQFALGHQRGSTHGPTRVFRPFYANPLYVEMARAAQAEWQSLEQRTGTKLLRLCGQLILANPENSLYQEGLAALRKTQEAHEELTKAQLSSRFPMFGLSPGHVACWVPRAGFLEPDRSLQVLVSEARKAGATVLSSQKVVGLNPKGGCLEVATQDSRITCQRLICTGGSWTAALLPSMKLNLKVTRQQKFHFRSLDVNDLQPDRVPVYVDHDKGYYGFPVWRGILNVADDNLGDSVQADEVDQEPDPEVRQNLTQWVEALFPKRKWEHVHTETCLYTNTPDDDFILDRHPELSNVIVGAGFSGHGFKFTPFIGKLLVQLALEETPELDIRALAMQPERNLSRGA
jgi:sarcosine oxidase